MNAITQNYTFLPDEVLHNVLLRLDRQDAIHATAVCSQWRKQLIRLFSETLHMQIATLPYAGRIWDVMRTQPRCDTWYEVIKINYAVKKVYGQFGVSSLMSSGPLLYENCLEHLEEVRKHVSNRALRVAWPQMRLALGSQPTDIPLPEADAAAEDIRNCLVAHPSLADYKALHLRRSSEELTLSYIPLEIHLFTALTILRICCTQICELPEMKLPALKSLHLFGNNLVAVTNLSNLTNLEKLNISQNSISRIENLNNLSKLRLVRCINNDLVDISAFSALSALQHLDLFNNQIHDISALASLPNLTELFLSRNRIVDPSPLATLPSLRCVDLVSNSIHEFPAYPQVLELYLYNNPCFQLSDVDPYTNFAMASRALYYTRAAAKQVEEACVIS